MLIDSFTPPEFERRMSAVLDDPTAPTTRSLAGVDPPIDSPPTDIEIKQVTLRDRVTVATLVPFSSPEEVPPGLAAYLCALLNREIETGDTYPMVDALSQSSFASYWFAHFGAVMILGGLTSAADVGWLEQRGVDWSCQCLGSFYVKPNYPGRSSHVCNAGFLVSDVARNRGVGRTMGECYLEWAPRLGYRYSIFNLVYETNVASLRIWDALGFKRVGRVKGAGQLRSYPGEYIDAIIFGRELGGDADEAASDERFDKIRYYLQTGTYPPASDRAEKSRLRSAATHYRLVPCPDGHPDGGDAMLMLKGKEVVSDPHRQYEIARAVHGQAHGGINKTTATIAEKYHWVRIKETVSAAIRNCEACKDAPAARAAAPPRSRRGTDSPADVHAAGSAPGSSLSSPTTAARGADNRPLRPRAVVAVSGPASDGNPSAPAASMADYADVPVDPQILHEIPRWDPAAEAQGMEVDGELGGADGASRDAEQEKQLREQLELELANTSGATRGG